MIINIVIKAVFALLSFTHSDVIVLETAALHAEPSYAKWGKLAMQETSKAYSDASIVNYKYEGRKKLPNGESEESFVLLLNKDAKQIAIRVTIKVSTDTDKLINVNLKELNDGI
ncbi:DUF3889 domain-containing protein [Bacillus sp. FJAT-28004]|uniref:DUF3889 domain-containing protein n=1 Tax=Bacillus sp. FJAT-28004 TaxID=1679165 RepID=UPI0006B58393|nr:DUF3889 domain-containing protein [Bacillus sp. FJAT-28004]